MGTRQLHSPPSATTVVSHQLPHLPQAPSLSRLGACSRSVQNLRVRETGSPWVPSTNACPTHTHRHPLLQFLDSAPASACSFALNLSCASDGVTKMFNARKIGAHPLFGHGHTTRQCFASIRFSPSTVGHCPVTTATHFSLSPNTRFASIARDSCRRKSTARSVPYWARSVFLTPLALWRHVDDDDEAIWSDALLSGGQHEQH